jgi:protein LTV1
VDLGPDELSGNAREGEASLYGVYFDDSTYDYMQHLKPVGTSEAGVDSVLLEAPTTKAKGKAKLVLRDLPPEALPSTSELPRNYEDQEAIPSSIAGFRPDLDPHLRQALEALEDDAFVDDGLDDDFFGELIADGEREPEEGEPAFGSDDEDGFADAFAKAARLDAAAAEGEDAVEEGWEDRFAAFKKSQKAGELEGAASDDDDDEGRTEGADTVGTLPRLAVVGGKRRRKGTSDASGYSMSSSSMFRNEGLTTLDERFDQVGRLILCPVHTADSYIID